ncbi:MAG: hypothetical protein KM312_00585 [Hydrogenibacillus schlegelii]|uniref:Uncharacterized protein n=1 Tax=Hydrogenibacillus schlegelii TaxID=1484 RepID=A0A947D1K5_HYDSH|nr:hypothetical protein [Hydrogenibacillus schlegelii]
MNTMIDRLTFGILGIALMLLATLTGVCKVCKGPDTGRERDTVDGKGPMQIAFRVVAAEKTLPADFTSVAPEDVPIRVATNEDALQALWSHFGLQSPVPPVRWDREVIMLLGTGESSNCPLKVRENAFDRDSGRLQVRLERYTGSGNACYLDFAPRTFALVAKPSIPLR